MKDQVESISIEMDETVAALQLLIEGLDGDIPRIPGYEKMFASRAERLYLPALQGIFRAVSDHKARLEALTA